MRYAAAIVRVPAVPFVLLVACLVGHAPVARADDWDDARKAFRQAQRAGTPPQRADAWSALATFDSAASVAEMLSALAKEEHPVVLRTALRTIAGVRSDEARAAFDAGFAKASGEQRLLMLATMVDQRPSPESDALLIRELAGKDPPSVALAAHALGRRRALTARDALLDALRHADGRVRSSVAWALQGLATPPPPAPGPGDPDPAQPPAPEAMREPAVRAALVRALFAEGAGAERGPLLAALRRITGQDYGLDAKAWASLLAGTEASAIRARPPGVPHVFGIPIHGRRIAIVIDKSMRFDDVHPFDEERLRSLCEVPGGRAIAHFKLLRVRHLVFAHVARLVEDLPSGSEVEVILFNQSVDPVFGRLTKVNAAARKTLSEAFDGMQVNDGIASYDALDAALGLGGASSPVRWKKGVEEVVFVTVNMPTKGAIVEPTEVAAAVTLKARLAAVRIHTVGILTHPYDLCRGLAAETGGLYRDLTK